MKLKSKFIIFMLLLNILIAFSAFAVVYLMSGKYIIQVYTEHGKRALEYAKLIANNTPAAVYIETSDKNSFLDNFSAYINSKNVDYIIIVDNYKNIISGRYNKSFRKSVFQNTSSFSIIPEVYITYDSNMTMYTVASIPIFNSSSKKVGNIITGFNLSNPKYTSDIKNVFGVDATIFYKNIRVNTTISKVGSQVIGTTLDSNIYNNILNKRSGYIGKASILNTPYITSYIPMYDGKGEVVGVVFAGKSLADIWKLRTNIILVVLGASLLIFLFAIILSYQWFDRKIVIPVMNISNSILKLMKNKVSENSSIFNENSDSDELNYIDKSIEKMVDMIVEYDNKLEKSIYSDQLTSLPNKAALYKIYGCVSYLYHGYTHCTSNEDECNLFDTLNNNGYAVIINISDMKVINETLGHTVGDILLKKTADLLFTNLDYVRDNLFRLGGDEFLICKNNIESYDEIERIIKDVANIFSSPCIINNNTVSISSRIGIALAPKDGNNLNTLLKNADIAMNNSDKIKKHSFAYFKEDMLHALQNQLRIENDLKTAVANKEFTLYYQPIYNLENSKIEKFEALIRWHKPERGFIPPLEFIGIAEETGLIITLGNWIIETAAVFIKNINEKLNKSFIISINMSIVQLMQDNFVESVKTILNNHDINPKYIELEITESVLMESFSSALSKLESLRELGIGIALDDFGTGYSSLSYIKKLPISVLKIDKSFIDDIEHSKFNITEDIINMGNKLGLKIVAEGIEKKEQMDILQKYKCDYIQGYYISRPVSEADIYTFLKK